MEVEMTRDLTDQLVHDIRRYAISRFLRNIAPIGSFGLSNCPMDVATATQISPHLHMLRISLFAKL